MKTAGFLGCLGVEALKLRRTMALVLVVLLPAATVATFLVYLLQNGTAFSEGQDRAAMIVWGLLSLWTIFVLPIFAAVETSLLAAVEHQNRGWKHLFALPPARGSLIAAKFAADVLLVSMAHAFLFAYALVLFCILPRLQPGGLDGPIPVVAILVSVATCAASSLFVVGVHTFISLRWSSFALNVGIAVGALLCAVGMLDTPLGRFFPWSLPAVAHRVAVPWMFHLPGWTDGLGKLVILLCISGAGFVVTAIGGGWALSRRDVF